MSEKHLPIMGGGYDRIVCDLDGTAWVPERTCHRVTLGLERDREIATVSWICSECHAHMGNASNYCPNCGAKVVEQ